VRRRGCLHIESLLRSRFSDDPIETLEVEGE
jgi:hypothetical protein